MKVILFLADGFEEVEAIIPWDMLLRAGAKVTAVSVMPQKTVISVHNIKIEADCLFNNAQLETADMFILPGGSRGTENLKNHLGLINVLKQANEKGKFIASICAAPSVLGYCGLLNGKTATAYPSFRDKLDGAVLTDDSVVCDDNIITAAGAGVSYEFAFKLIELLYDIEAVEKIKRDIIFKG